MLTYEKLHICLFNGLQQELQRWEKRKIEAINNKEAKTVETIEGIIYHVNETISGLLSGKVRVVVDKWA